jgi:hypothetical protein
MLSDLLTKVNNLSFKVKILVAWTIYYWIISCFSTYFSYVCNKGKLLTLGGILSMTVAFFFPDVYLIFILLAYSYTGNICVYDFIKNNIKKNI